MWDLAHLCVAQCLLWFVVLGETVQSRYRISSRYFLNDTLATCAPTATVTTLLLHGEQCDRFVCWIFRTVYSK